MPKLNQILAVEKGTKSKSFSELTKINNLVQKPGLFSGFTKNYNPKDEDGEHFPPESQHVQLNAQTLLKKVSHSLIELFDITATKDLANTKAVADVVVDDLVLLKKVPATTILFLEKKVSDVRTLVQNLPTLDPAERWRFDLATNVFRGELTKTARTKKCQKPVVLYPATEQHPAQTQLVSEDVVIGHWDTVKQSGALSVKQKEDLIARTEKLLRALKFARESANAIACESVQMGNKVFTYLMTDATS